MPRYPTTPLWLKLSVSVSVLLLAATAWCLLDRTDRAGNERRLSAIASQIACRAVKVHCPGPLARVFGGSTAEGWVKFDAAGKPADETKLQKTSCAELRARPRALPETQADVEPLFGSTKHNSGFYRFQRRGRITGSRCASSGDC